MYYTLKLPDGHRRSLNWRHGQDRVELLRRFCLDQYEGYCDSNWLSHNHDTIDNPELRVKRFLDCCAWFLLRGDSEDTVTPYKESMNGKREIPISSCPISMQDLFYGNGQTIRGDDGNEYNSFQEMLERLDEKAKPHEPKKKPARKKTYPPTRFQRIEQIKREVGPCEFIHCRVDTENAFELLGKRYQIDASVEAYRPRQTKEGLLYDMDQVIAIVGGGEIIRFYDQGLTEIPLDAIVSLDSTPVKERGGGIASA